MRRTPNMLAPLANHLMYFALSGDLPKARRIGRIALARAFDYRNDFVQVGVFRSAALWLAQEAVAGNATITLPRSIFTGDSSRKGGRGEPVSVADAAQTCLQEAARYADALDGRNGTRRYGEIVDGAERMIRSMAERSANKLE